MKNHNHTRNSRSRLSWAVICAVALLTIAACGEESAEPELEAEVRTFETAMGPVEIPVDPQRVVSLDSSYTLHVLDEVDTSLVGTQTRTDGVWDALSESAQELTSIGESGSDNSIDFEAIIALEPDLIMGTANNGSNEEIYDQLSEIAPTVLIDRYIQWDERMRILADAANRSEEAETLISAVEGRIPELEAAIAERWPDGIQLTLIRLRDVIRIETVSDNRDEDVAKWLLREIDAMTHTGDVVQASGTDTDISTEQLRLIDGDVIFYFPRGGGDSGETEEELVFNFSSNPLWDSLSAVQAGRVHQVDPDIWFSGFGATALNRAIDDLFEFVAEAP
jgi:iron complex transport system substrate-binding protein